MTISTQAMDNVTQIALDAIWAELVRQCVEKSESDKIQNMEEGLNVKSGPEPSTLPLPPQRWLM